MAVTEEGQVVFQQRIGEWFAQSDHAAGRSLRRAIAHRVPRLKTERVREVTHSLALARGSRQAVASD
jgi:hypothetical protein